MNREDRTLLEQRRCYVCLRVIPETKGTRWFGPAMWTCYPGSCYDRAIAAEKDHSRSRRGRRLPTREFLAKLRAMRPEVQPVDNGV